MKFSVRYSPSAPPSASPYRLFDEHDQEVVWANAFLDGKRLGQRSLRSLRAYAFGLLSFARWSHGDPPHSPSRPLQDMTESTLADFAASLLDRPSPPRPTTINYRLRLVRNLYRFHFHCNLPAQAAFQRVYYTQSSLGYGRRRRAIAQGLHLTEPRRLVQPLSPDDVCRFWSSFHSFRDLAIVGLMLLDGLRSCEVLALQVPDLRLHEAQLRVLGKGQKTRFLPLSQDIVDVLQSYLFIERPRTNSNALFVCWKGRSRGLPLTSAGLRSLFRHHRSSSQVPLANPHRFRHTFGADMVRAGISLPALQHLMGHADIRTTLSYVQLAPEDVWREFHAAIAKRKESPADVHS